MPPWGASPVCYECRQTMGRLPNVVLLAAGLLAVGIPVAPAAQCPAWGDTG